MTQQLMFALVVTFGVSLVACLLLTPLVRALARRQGLVDRPDGRRKMHKRNVPVAGGLAILLAVGIAMPLLQLAPAPVADELPSNGYLWGLLLAGLLICGVGVLTDISKRYGSILRGLNRAG